jgi:predicted phosphodiesterase
VKKKSSFGGLEILIRKSIERWIIIPDVHLTEDVPKPYKIVKKIISNNNFDGAIILGDYMDISSLSDWDKDKRKLLENQRYQKEIDCANKELDFIQKYISNTVYIIGNHENRVDRYIEKNPELEGLLEVPKILKLEERKIECVELNQLLKIGHCYFTHGMFTGKNHASQHLMTLGCNIVYGHKHQSQHFMTNMKMQKPIVAYGLGCLCDLNQPYLKGIPPVWINAFAIIDFDKDTGSFNVMPINIIQGVCMYHGKKYKL